MTAVSTCISALNEHLGPALTWHGTNALSSSVSLREELGGPVLARWLSKVSNLMGTDLADLFGDAGAGRSIIIDLPGTWQGVVWAVSASMMGWEVSFDPTAADTDVLVTNRPSEDAQRHLDAGSDVLFHNTAPLAVSWQGSLPNGAMDALEAIMSQPDGLIVDLALSPTPLPPLPDEAAAGASSASTPEGAAGRPLLRLSDPGLLATLVRLWATSGSAVVVPGDLDDAEAKRIANVEKAEFEVRLNS